ncbi:PD-(D/E)XK nuclease family protein [Candidatus Daviesbacteria bacterium]|nr:PD-(D/E)XK nuclease family protein [Candidatus Daviesbacteria bacterium]
MAFDNIPRTHCFSLGDLHEYDRCVFSFFVKHHLGKKYELAEGNANQVIGTLLDIAMKKLHQTQAYDQPPEYLQNLVKAAERIIREDVEKRGKNSFYGAQIEFLTEETILKAQEIFKKYTENLAGKYKKYVQTAISQRPKPFWERVIASQQSLKLWGAPDAIEMGEDGIPEVVDYKYFEDLERAQKNIDMDLMPKVYTLLCAQDLQESGYSRVRFKVRFWQDPKNESFYEEFDLLTAQNLENFLKDKIERILRTTEISFCEKAYCQVCLHPDRPKWLQELADKGFSKLWKE